MDRCGSARPSARGVPVGGVLPAAVPRCCLVAVLLAAGLAAAVGGAAPAAVAGTASVPRPDHVVVVLEENHAAPAVVGNPDAPWITALAQQGANFTSSYAVTHPSQPNYLALFSGDTQGVTDDSCPHTFTTPDLGDQLAAAGLGFAGYSEDLPAVGSTTCGSSGYVRKHAPWVNWPSVPAAANQPFSAFPTTPEGWAALPQVSFVVPDLGHDMHDGTVAQGDAWLQANLGGYVSWATSHNSLFVLTFDEDDFTAANRIATVFAGARVTPGTYDEHIDHYSVLRTLEDAYGLPALGHAASAAPVLDVWSPATGRSPTASFTSACAGATCDVDGSASTDPDGTVVGWSWSFGDGTSGSGASTTHSYAAGGTYPVVLTVTDDTGATGTVTHTVAVSDPPGAPFASDTFARTVSGGWGRADVGGTWSVTSPAAWSVAPGAGTVTMARPGALLAATLPGAARTDSDVRAEFSVDEVPTATAYLAVTARDVPGVGAYRAKLRLTSAGTVNVSLVRSLGSTDVDVGAAVAVPNLRYAAGTPLEVRVQAVGPGPTQLRTKVWAGPTEPAGWTVTATDATASLQAPGGPGLWTYLSSAATNAPMSVRVTGFSARATASTPPPPPPDQPPTASFVASCNGLGCAVDGTASTDPDGRVVGWSWAFGDATSATGSTATHTYAAAGTYPVTLTVTDDVGVTASVTHTVSPSAPVDVPIAADAFARTVTGGWGTADVGGRWTSTGAAANSSVTPGAGQWRIPTAGTTVGASLATSATDVDLLTTVSVDRVPNGNGLYLTVSPRRVGAGTEYRADLRLRPDGTVAVGVARTSGGVATALSPLSLVPGLAYAAGTRLDVRVQTSGTSPTTVRARVWADGATEPTTWSASAADATAGLQVAGGIACTAYLSSSATNAPVVVRVVSVAARVPR